MKPITRWPWETQYVGEADGERLFDVFGGEGSAPVADQCYEADAWLISAAPDLLEALKKALAALESYPPSMRSNEIAAGVARAAIAKAEGK